MQQQEQIKKQESRRRALEHDVKADTVRCRSCVNMYPETYRFCPHCGKNNPKLVSRPRLLKIVNYLSEKWRKLKLHLVFLIVPLLVVVAFLFYMVLFGHDELSDAASTVLSGVTILAVVIGGYWTYMLFVRNRTVYPRAEVSHSIMHWDIDEDKYLLRIDVTVKNLGEVLLPIELLRIHIYCMKPWSDKVIATLEGATNATRYGETEAGWERVKSKAVTFPRGDFEIEPNEKDVFSFDYAFPLGDEYLCIYTYLENTKKKRRGIGWGETSYYSLTEGGSS